MDFDVSSLGGFVSSENNETSSQLSSMEAKPKLVLDEFRLGKNNKQERSSAGCDDFYVQKTMLLHQNTTLLLRSNSMVHGDTQQQRHISNFSSLKPVVNKDDGFMQRSFKTYTGYPYYQSPSAYARRIGSSVTENLSMASMRNRPVSGTRGPFTPSQRMELQHQSLIFKYISASLPVPPNLLIPLINNSVYLSPSSSTVCHPNTLGCKSHVNYIANSDDPEPGRCRRTDGKKWRCSKDAVPDQKYCERHINRGRHRSRKPVEGQTDYATNSGTNAGASNNLVITQQKFKNIVPDKPNSYLDAFVNRYNESERNVYGSVKPQGLTGFSVMPSTMNLKPVHSNFSLHGTYIPIQESLQSEFGHVSFDSQKMCYMNAKTCESFPSFNNQETQDLQHPLRQFKDQPSRSIITWPEELKSDCTQLSREFDPRMSSDISKGTSIGGDPLGEVLTNSIGNYASSSFKNSWYGSAQFGYYPNDHVLQTEGSASSKSEIKMKNNEDGDVLGSTTVGSSTI